MKYWIACISKNHIERGIKDQFIQVCHGKKAPLQRMKTGDKLIVYSSKINLSDSVPYQKFTTLGTVINDEIFQFQLAEDFIPFRRNVQYSDCKEVDIIPLINDLDFIIVKKYWGYPFRYGFFEISEKDYNLISSKMMI